MSDLFDAIVTDSKDNPPVLANDGEPAKAEAVKTEPTVDVAAVKAFIEAQEAAKSSEPEKVEPEAKAKVETPALDEAAELEKWKHYSRLNEEGKKAAISEKEQLAAKVTELEQIVLQMQRTATIGQVLTTHNLPDNAKKFLTANTEAELTAQAKELVELFAMKGKVGRPAKPVSNPFQGQTTQPRESLSLGEIAVNS